MRDPFIVLAGAAFAVALIALFVALTVYRALPTPATPQEAPAVRTQET